MTMTLRFELYFNLLLPLLTQWSSSSIYE